MQSTEYEVVFSSGISGGWCGLKRLGPCAKAPLLQSSTRRCSTLIMKRMLTLSNGL